MLPSEYEKVIIDRIQTITFNALAEVLNEIKNADHHDQVLSQQEAAEFLRISPKTLIQLVKKGKVKRQKLGKQIKYLKSDLIKSLES